MSFSISQIEENGATNNRFSSKLGNSPFNSFNSEMSCQHFSGGCSLRIMPEEKSSYLIEMHIHMHLCMLAER